MKEDKTIFKTINLPHIGYKVIVKDLKYLQGIEIKGPAYTVTFDNNTSYIFVENVEKNSKKISVIPTLAHEVIHVLQNICAARQMDFTKESEHMAYIMSHILNKIMGYSYVLEKKDKGHAR